MDNSLFNLLLLQDLFGAGSNRAYKLYEKIESAGMLNDDIRNIVSKITFADNVRFKLENADYKKPKTIVELCKKHNVSILKITDDDYPESLKSINTPPIILFYRGKFPDFDILPSITIVGPRKPSEYGKKAAFSLGLRLSRAGMIVVSGGALGCDTAAHKGVFATDGITVAVLGCGIDAEYLAENKEIRDKAQINGCLLSEYPPLTKPTKHSFPVRNRIMAGLTLGTVVIEAGEKSGSLITAKSAAEQGRDVFVIPGTPSKKEYKGSNNLLREGAKPLIDASDIFNEYLPLYPQYIDIEKAFSKVKTTQENKKIIKIQKNLHETLSKEAEIVYNYLDRQIFSVDSLSGTGLSTDSILSSLTELELENLIEPLPGGKYSLK